MKILVTAATHLEIAPFEEFMSNHAVQTGIGRFEWGQNEINTLVTGIGSVHVSFAMARFNNINQIDLIINVGIAGSFDRNIKLASVVTIVKDCFADLGIEDKDGGFQSLWDGPMAPNHYPYDDFGWMKVDLPLRMPSIPEVVGITLNTVTGTDKKAQLLSSMYQAQVETMESAAFIYVAKMLKKKHLSIRSISNYVENRDKSTWKLGLALKSMTTVLINYLSGD